MQLIQAHTVRATAYNTHKHIQRIHIQNAYSTYKHIPQYHTCNKAADSAGSMYTSTHSAINIVGAAKSTPAALRPTSSAAVFRRSAATRPYKQGDGLSSPPGGSWDGDGFLQLSSPAP